MAVWHKVIRDEEYLKTFMEMNWEFHDCREERITYIAETNSVEIFLKYDTGAEGVLIQFKDVHGFNVRVGKDYEAEWIGGVSCLLLPGNSFLWIVEDELSLDKSEQIEEAKKYCTWVEAESIIWAVTDGEGNPIDMPEDRINQTWNVWGETVEKHFKVMACE